eukprot:COSAG06_NODE_29086_length_562_cov_3.721382_1_plen_42_part_10
MKYSVRATGNIWPRGVLTSRGTAPTPWPAMAWPEKLLTRSSC